MSDAPDNEETPPVTLGAMLDHFAPHPNSNMAKLARATGVTRSEEFVRILNLPRRESPRDLTDLLTAAYRTPHGTMDLRPLQSYSLTEVFDYRGLFCLMPVGSGKTLVSLLAPRILSAERPLLLVPANLKAKTIEQDIPEYRLHWQLHENLRVMSYSKLSRAPSPTAIVDAEDDDAPSGVLWDLMPDVIIADEIHHLKNPRAARTRRFLRYFKERPNTILIALSGTMTRKSIRDYWHILKLCLPNQCPLPFVWKRAEEWADALDADVPEDKRVNPGALQEFCAEGENVRQGFRRRLIETPGIIGAMGISAFGDEPEPGIEIHEVEPPEVPEQIEESFHQLRTTWSTPGGEEISDGMSLWRHASSLALGFYTKWIWPGLPGVYQPGEPDTEWLDKRKAWKKFVRHTLTNNRRGLDSELQVANACEAGEYNSTEWAAWIGVRGRYGPTGPPTETVWVDHWLVDHAAQSDAQIIWTRSPGVGQAIASRANVPYFGAGNDGILDFEGNKCVASIQSHGTGKNLQRYHRNLFVGTPYGGADWQQTLGRTHRPGQAADVVEYKVYLHCKELWNGFQRALVEARYIEDTTDDRQKLLQATIDLVHTADAVASLEDSGHARWR
jgi:hypothetical protein